LSTDGRASPYDPRIKLLGRAPIRLAAASLLGATLVIAAPVAALASPTTASKAGPTTTTTTKPGKTAAFAKLVIKANSVGHVNVETAGTSTFKPAKNGQSLHVGDTVQTDATGQAEIDYADTAYTRLDVNTTFTIKKLTDSQGNRQVEGSLDVGRTYNRTAALTQSQTFQQDAGGATAAVAGTAFVVTCTSATSCTFTAVIDNINLTGAGETKTLNPLDECVANNGALCGTTTRLTPDEVALIQWIQTNVYLDLAEHGIGDGVFQPFAATVVVSGAVVQSVSAAPTPPGSPPPPPPDNDLAISTAPNRTAIATNANGAPVAFAKPTATDESGETPTVVCDHNSGDVFRVGTTTVTCTATDTDDANSAVHSTFTVTVTDGDLSISNPGNQSTTAPTTASSTTFAYARPIATDEGGQNPSVVCNHDNNFPVGVTPVTCTATDSDDANGPQSSSFNVTVYPNPQVNTAPTNLSTNGDDTTTTASFNLTGGTDSGQPFSYQYTQLNLVGGSLVDNTNQNVALLQPYAPSMTFTYHPAPTDPENGPTAVLNYQTVDNTTHATSPSTGTVNINVPNPPGEG
jgi:HYR domain/FecR protein